MVNRFSGLARPVALVLVVTSALGSLGWLWWSSTRRSDINFLPRLVPAEWIIYPSGQGIVPHPRLGMETRFERTFALEQTPSKAVLSVAGLGHYTLSINGKAAAAPTQPGRNWKQPDRFEVSRELRAGENQIAVTVLNSNGPPVLWLSLDKGSFHLNSDETWQASYAGAVWRNAHLARQPKVALAGSPLYGGEEPWASLRARWLTLLLFAALSATIYWFSAWRKQTSPLTPHPSPLNHLPLLGLAALWGALFANNLRLLPPLHGFDLEPHLAYIGYLQEHQSLPLAGEGAEMVHPPLYYLLGATLLSLLSLSVSQPGGVMALRIMGLGIGIAHFALVWASLRWLFPSEQSKQRWGLVMAAAMPPLLYLSQYVSNEALAAALVSGCVYLALRILKQEQVSWKLCAGLGLCLGAALLTKSTALPAVPVILGALLWKAWLTPRSGTPHSALGISQVGLVLGVCAVVCGWHYARLWVHYGSPLVGNWDPRTGLSWWQDDGYRTSAFYLRFGEVLVHPCFSGFKSFGDGMYSTLWGDGLLAGAADFLSRPPWNYDLMAVGYWLALIPTLGILAGGLLALAKFIRQPSAEWFMMLGLGFVVAFALLHMSLVVPYISITKAFYGLSALVPLCACGALGLDALCRWSGKLRPMICILFGVWALTSYATFWVSRSAAATVLVRARVLATQGREREAAELLNARLEIEPHNSEMRSLLADILTDTDGPAEARKQAEVAVRDQPNDARARLSLGAVLARLQQNREAIEQAERAIQLAPGLGQAYQQLAALLARQERYDEAIRVSREGIGAAPFNAELRLILGNVLLLRGQPAESSSQIQLASELKAYWSGSPGTPAAMPPGTGNLDEAIARYSEALRLDPTNALLHINLAAALVMQDKVDDAISHYQAAVAIQPGSDAARLGLGEALSKKGRYPEAIEQFSEILRFRPDHAPALVQLGIARARWGKPGEAVQAFTEALRINPADAGAHNSLGNVLAQQGRHEEAVREFEQALRLNPDHAGAHNNLAISCKKLGRVAEAIAHYREAIRLQPDSLQALNNLAWTLAAHPEAQFRNGAEAVGLATRACEATKYQNPIPLATLAAAYAEAGQFREAVSFAERAQELAKGDQGPLVDRLSAMLEAFQAGRPYHAE
jgi:tetratricopeptide (TPR) repeat protein